MYFCVVVDSEGTPIVDENMPLYSGSKVKLGFFQKPYILKDGVTYGTSLKLVGVQVVELGGSTGGGEAEPEAWAPAGTCTYEIKQIH